MYILSYDVTYDTADLLFLSYLIWIIFSFFLNVFYVVGNMWFVVFSAETAMKYIYQLYRLFYALVLLLMIIQLLFLFKVSWYFYSLIPSILRKEYIHYKQDFTMLQKELAEFIYFRASLLSIILTIHAFFSFAFFIGKLLRHPFRFSLTDLIPEMVLPDALYGLGVWNNKCNIRVSLFISVVFILIFFFVSWVSATFLHMYLVQPYKWKCQNPSPIMSCEI